MAKKTKKFNKNLAFMFIVPVLVIVVTMSIMGVTFAWFTQAEQTSIATINMSVAETFQITFDVLTGAVDEYGEELFIYNGQEALDEKGLLITEVHANEMGLDDNNSNYIKDRAFSAPFYVKFDTNMYDSDGETVLKKHEVDFTCIIESVHVHKKGSSTELKLPNDNGTTENAADDITVEDIKLGFTWYIEDTINNCWYTPYGTISSTQTTDATTNGPIQLPREDWSAPILNKGFSASSLNQTDQTKLPHIFHIVFAPEVLFWKQYGKNVPNGIEGVAEYNETAANIYGSEFGSTKWNTVNSYSASMFTGSTYSFTIMLTVSNVTEVA
ncbi:MAG: hypothetical protein J6U74_05110 [Clostridia bacterium]|nr:hypothetical protein [Clostridia bacterium]